MLPEKFYDTLEAVLYIALHSGGRAVSSTEICKYKQVSPRHLEQVMQLLVRHHILKGVTGPKGGYTLAREKRKMTLAEIWHIFDVHPVQNESHTPIQQRIQHTVKIELNDLIVRYLQTVTLDDLCKQITQEAMDRSGRSDFII